jgi:hypothetical protein
MLRELYDHNNIKILGLTSAKGWQIVENPKEYFDLLPYFIARKIVKKQNNSYQYFLCPHSPDSPQVIEKKSVPEIRSEAMASLGFPFEESFGSVTVVLHPVMTSYSRLPPGPFQRGHFFLRNHEILAYHFPEQNSPLQRQNIFCDFFVRNTKNGGNYKKIIACPVYENGVIFSNFIDQKNAWQKGPIVRSFLFSLLGKNRGSWPPLTAIAIDDNLQMLISIQKYCDILEIPFIGIHLAYREKSVPTRLLMQGTFKKNYFYD